MSAGGVRGERLAAACVGVDGESLPSVCGDAGAELGGGDEVAARHFLESFQSIPEDERTCFPGALQGDRAARGCGGTGVPLHSFESCSRRTGGGRISGALCRRKLSPIVASAQRVVLEGGFSPKASGGLSGALCLDCREFAHGQGHECPESGQSMPHKELEQGP